MKKSETDVTLRLSSGKTSADKNNFPHNLLLTNRQVTSLCKAFAKILSKYVTLSKTRISKIIKSSGFLGRLLGPLMKVSLLLIKTVLKLLA